MTNPGETFWEDVGEPAANELVGTEMENDGFVGRGVSPEEFDVPFLIVSEETFGVEGAAVDVSGGVA